MFSITTCKRFDLFEKTINSFIQCCKDVLLIDKWLCIDDNSSDTDREKMKCTECNANPSFYQNISEKYYCKKLK